MSDQKQLLSDLTSLAREDLVAFSTMVQTNYEANWHHELIADKLMAVESGKIKRLMIFMPPRHGKSQLATIHFPAWYLGRNPTKEIITASYSGELAMDFGSKTRDLLQDDMYHAIFDTRLKADAKSKGKWQTQDKGSYTSVGVGGSLTGRGADILLIDDPVKDRADADSPTIRNKNWDWYTSTAGTRLEKGGAVIVIQTRWHLDDLSGRLLEQMKEGKEQWDVLELPAIATKDEKHRKEGEPLWPNKYTVEDLEAIRDRNLMDWASLYQQNPIISEHAEFKQEYFRHFEESDLAGKQLDYYTTVDLAISKKDSADFTAIVTVGKERDKPDWYVVDITHGRFTPSETIEAIFSLYHKYRMNKIGIEAVAYQKAMLYFLEEEQKKRSIFLPVEEINTNQNKEAKIRMLQPMYKLGVIHHRGKVQTQLELELLQFPKSKHDDIIDALSMQIGIMENTRRGGRNRINISTNSRGNIAKTNQSNNHKTKRINYLTGQII